MRQCIRAGVGIHAVILIGLVCSSCDSESPPQWAQPVPEGYVEEIESWRQNRIARLSSDTGWLTLVGLDWLEPGRNRFGTGEDCAVRFPEWTGVPRDAGVLILEDGKVRLEVATDTGVEVNGSPPGSEPLATDAGGKPDFVAVGDLTFHIIRRGERVGVRSKHRGHPALASFHGTEWFEIDPAYRVEAHMERYDPRREVAIPTVLGMTETMFAPGVARFTLDGQPLALEPVVSTPDDTNLFFIFRDGTSGEQTYPPGRFLYADLQPDGTVVIDFNKAYNPPCAFTPFATCPLPPRRNWLKVPIPAGEKNYGDH